MSAPPKRVFNAPRKPEAKAAAAGHAAAQQQANSFVPQTPNGTSAQDMNQAAHGPAAQAPYLYQMTRDTNVASIKRNGLQTAYAGRGGLTAAAAANTGRTIQPDHDLSMLHFDHDQKANLGRLSEEPAAQLRVHRDKLASPRVHVLPGETRYSGDIPKEHLEVRHRNGNFLPLEGVNPGDVHTHDEIESEAEED